MKEFKIRIYTHSDWALVQKRLFSLGCVWASDGQKILYETNYVKYIYVRDKIITKGDSTSYFESAALPEITIDDLHVSKLDDIQVSKLDKKYLDVTKEYIDGLGTIFILPDGTRILQTSTNSLFLPNPGIKF